MANFEISLVNGNAVKALGGTFKSENFGLTKTDLNRDENGKAMLVQSDGMECAYNGSNEEMRAIKALAALNDFDNLAPLVRAWNVGIVASLAKQSGFKSVGKFLSKNLGLDEGTCNQLYRVSALLVSDDNGNISYFDKCLNDVAPSTLYQCFGVINKMEGETIRDKVKAFALEYCTNIPSEEDPDIFEVEARVHWTGKGAQGRVKDELRELFGKDKGSNGNGNDKDKDKDKDKNKGSNGNGKDKDKGNKASNTEEETEEVIIAKAISIAEKYGRHDIALLLNDIIIGKEQEEQEEQEEQ